MSSQISRSAETKRAIEKSIVNNDLKIVAGKVQRTESTDALEPRDPLASLTLEEALWNAAYHNVKPLTDKKIFVPFNATTVPAEQDAGSRQMTVDVGGKEEVIIVASTAHLSHKAAKFSTPEA